jgi:cytochrome b5
MLRACIGELKSFFRSRSPMAPKAELKVYTMAEVAEHTAQDDMWMAIHGKVYDVTSFLDDHPGGDEVMKDTAGRNATVEYEDVGHSEEATKMMEPLLIGVLAEGEDKVVVAPKAQKAFAVKEGKDSRWQRVAIPLIVIFLTIVIRYIIVNKVLA